MLSFILALILLSLVNKPCADDVQSLIEDGTELVQLTDQPEQEQENHEDDCSPFCSCNCCQTQIAKSAALLFVIQPFIEGENAENQQSLLSQISFAIWEPPQHS